MYVSVYIYTHTHTHTHIHTHPHTHTHTYIYIYIYIYIYSYIIYGGPVGWGTELQAQSCGCYSLWAIGMFHWLNPSCRTVNLGSTHPPAEMSSRDGPCEGLTTLPPWCDDSLEILGDSTSCSPWACQANRRTDSLALYPRHTFRQHFVINRARCQQTVFTVVQCGYKQGAVSTNCFYCSTVWISIKI